MDDMKRTSEYRRMLPFIAKASNDVGADTQGQDIQALLLSLSTHKSSADHDGRYYTETETTGLLSYKVDKTLTLTAGDGLTGGGDLSIGRTFAVNSSVVRTTRTLTAGNGLTGGGDLAANRTFAVGQGFGLTVTADAVEVNLTSNYTWTGGHTFSGSLITGSIMPALSDVYDLGDYTKPWRKIWGSELSAVVFSQYEQVLLGGWLTISKGEGKLATAVTAAAIQIDLGAGTFVTNDILVFRSISSNGTPQVEYMKVGTLVSGTTYNMTRNLDGTGANDWPDGTVYGNWGQAGNGRVELNAYDTPRMSVYSHGAAIADFREQLRFGDLNGGWGYSSSVFGGAFGAYESGKANITIDPVNGLRIRNYNQDVIKLTGTTASFEQFITLGAAGGIRQGTGTWVTPPTAGNTFTGTALWAESSIMNMGGWNAGVKQWWGGSDGKFYAGLGGIKLDSDGITISDLPGGGSVSTLKFQTNTGAPIVNFWGYGTSTTRNLSCFISDTGIISAQMAFVVTSTVESNTKITLNANANANHTSLIVYPEYVNITTKLRVTELEANYATNAITYTATGGHTFVGPVTAAAANFSDNVGIRMTSPPVALQVNGVIRAANANDAGVLSLGEAGGGTTVNVGLSRGSKNAVSGGNWLNLGGYSGINFAASATNLGSQITIMSIDGSSGQVYIVDNCSALSYTDRP